MEKGAGRPWNDSTGGKKGEESNPCCQGKGQKKEAEAFREKNGDPSAPYSSGTEKTYQPKEQMKNRTGAQTGGQPEGRPPEEGRQ